MTKPTPREAELRRRCQILSADNCPGEDGSLDGPPYALLGSQTDCLSWAAGDFAGLLIDQDIDRCVFWAKRQILPLCTESTGAGLTGARDMFCGCPTGRRARSDYRRIQGALRRYLRRVSSGRVRR